MSDGSLPLGDLIDLSEQLGAPCLLTTRRGGVSEGPYESLNLGDHVGDEPERVARNRARVAAAIGVAPHALVVASQVHGADVLEVEAPAQGLIGDAMVTASREVALAVLVADCVPLALADKERVAVVHAGWRGLDARVIAAAVGHFSDPTAVSCVIGPAIEPARYPVGAEVAERFARWPSALLRGPDGATHLDLVAVARAQLADAGVAPASTTVLERHTGQADDFFSDRRERPCGRFALVVRRP